MHFDDRLATVLRQRAAGERAARTQYRQLLDLLDDRQESVIDALEESGWERLSNLSSQIPAPERAAILREGGWRFRNPALILFLAEQEPDVAASALNAVELAPDDWVLLIPELPLRARGFLRLRRDLPQAAQDVLDRLGVQDRALPRPPQADDDPLELDQAIEPPVEIMEKPPEAERQASIPVPDAPPIPVTGANEPGGGDNAISALVKRIEAFQKARRSTPQADRTNGARDTRSTRRPSEQPRQTDPVMALPASFDFTTDAGGTVDWADAEVAPMILGTALRDLAPGDAGHPDNEVTFALAHHLPVRHAQLTLRGAPGIAGEWIIDAVPQFDRAGGSFRGYLARARRPVAQDAGRLSLAEDRADRLRQLLHELRTPINAIQGYAEFIQQQMVGPAPHAYRALAASIGGDSARILSGFDDLERLSRLESGATSDAEQGPSVLHDTLAATVRQLRPALQARGASFDLLIRAPDAPVPLSRGDAELLFWRVLASVAAGTGEGETVEINLRARRQAVELTVALPRTLQASKDLFATDFRLASDTITPGIFGAGFALRLARAEAQAAGGSLQRDGDVLMLVLPVAENERRFDGGAAVAG